MITHSILALLFLACTAVPAPPTRLAEKPVRRRVVLITVDGARWQEIFGGVDPKRGGAAGLAAVPARVLLPNLYARVIDPGVALGARPEAGIAASGPKFVSLPGYRELATGRGRGACTRNDCAAMTEPTLLDELAQRWPARDVAVVASWERLVNAAAQSPERILLSAGRHGGSPPDRLQVSPGVTGLLDRGARAAPAPGKGDYRPDIHTEALALELLRAQRPHFLWVALGDTDEYAHAGDYRGYVTALSGFDRFLGRLFHELDTLEPDAPTLVIVTCDHGRAANFADHGDQPESAAAWLAAVGGTVPARGIVAAASERHLADVAPTVRAFLGLPRDLSANAGRALPELARETEWALGETRAR